LYSGTICTQIESPGWAYCVLSRPPIVLPASRRTRLRAESLATRSTCGSTSSVTSWTASSWSMKKSGSLRSSAREWATNPESSSVSPGFVTALMPSRAQWWFVTTRPWGETNAAEQPGRRSAAKRARANQAESAAKP
jgi:hypothetical protein